MVNVQITAELLDWIATRSITLASFDGTDVVDQLHVIKWDIGCYPNDPFGGIIWLKRKIFIDPASDLYSIGISEIVNIIVLDSTTLKITIDSSCDLLV